jgi:hypothetical protein
MLDFEYHSPTKLVFGADTHLQAGELIRPFAKKALLHYGGDWMKAGGLLDDMRRSLASADVERVAVSVMKQCILDGRRMFTKKDVEQAVLQQEQLVALRKTQY